jgi:hypothetical protein
MKNETMLRLMMACAFVAGLGLGVAIGEAMTFQLVATKLANIFAHGDPDLAVKLAKWLAVNS